MATKKSYRIEYRHWINMKSRCNNPNTPHYERYGGRGIKVCPEWDASFDRFFADMGPRPNQSWTIDRIDTNGDYTPENCRWATRKMQARNLRNNRVVFARGKEMTLAEAVEEAPVPYNTVLYRLKRGWDIENALSRPAAKGVRP
jgi:hypothetical protein